MRIGRAWGRWRGRKQRAGKAPTVGAAGRARAERTENMLDMLMTLDVLRLSDWLNADAPCRVEREAWQEGRHAGWEGVGAAAVQAACRKAPTVEAEGRARAERTRNMATMSVTPDVSKLSGWLNADAICRVKKEAQEG